MECPAGDLLEDVSSRDRMIVLGLAMAEQGLASDGRAISEISPTCAVTATPCRLAQFVNTHPNAKIGTRATKDTLGSKSPQSN